MDAFDNLAETSAWKAFSTCVLIRNIQKTFPRCYGEKFNIHLKSLTRVECLLTSRRLRRSSLYREVRSRALAE